MQPIPVFYDTIDRNAILVRPKQPYLDWTSSVFAEGKAWMQGTNATST